MDDYIFEMQGPAFENGDRLDKVAAGLTALQHFFDGTYRAITEKDRLSKRDRESFHVVISRYEDGSFIAYLGAVISGLQTTLPFLYSFTPAELWEHTKTAYEFLKLIFGLAHDKKQFTITQDGSGNVAVITEQATYNFHGPVYQIGTQIIGSLREMDNVLEEGQVERIALAQPSEPGVELTIENKGLFFPPTTVDETPVKLSCDIYDFNKYENQGRAHVGAGQLIPEGNYKFKNVGDQGVEEFILSMTETEVTELSNQI